ncbi:DUF4263 domain-containing protein [Sphingomonas koreensis]|nr:DUF4263 domain-containing protein [Sphingomonas koreensis]
MDDEHTIFRNRIAGKTVIGSRFHRGDKPARIASQVLDVARIASQVLDVARIASQVLDVARIASQVLDVARDAAFHVVDGEVVLRTTRGGRQMIKAVFLEDDRRIKTLSIQKYVGDGFAPVEQHFTFTGDEIDSLIEFLASVRIMPLQGSGKRHLTSSELRDLLLTQASAQQLFGEHEELFVEAARNAELKRDLIALGYRRKQLTLFERLMTDANFFTAERQALGPNKRPEDVWQAYFEKNPWIFGHGLSFIFSSALADRKLEQVVQGFSVAGPGKRVDALMKTRARINSLCFVEIKRHDTQLLAGIKDYRSGAYGPSAELGGGIAQVQATVQAAIDTIGRRVDLTDAAGNPTGEQLFNLDPRAFLLIGNLAEFETPNGTNEAKFRSFELFRRNVRRPEVITYDELLYRARFIVDHDT